MNPRFWSTDSDDFLRLYYDCRPTPWIATSLRRTTKAIYRRAEILGLHKPYMRTRIKEEPTDRQPGDPTPKQIQSRAAKIRRAHMKAIAETPSVSA